MWYLATNKIDVFHYSKMFENAVVTTGQPILLYFETEQALIDKLLEYGHEYVAPSLEQSYPPEPEEN